MSHTINSRFKTHLFQSTLLLLSSLAIFNCKKVDETTMRRMTGESTVNRLEIATVSGGAASAAAGSTLALTVTAIYSDNTTDTVTGDVTWSSSNAAVAVKGTGDGIINAVAAGSATLTASYDGKSGTIDVTVTSAALLSIAVTPTNPSIPKGNTQQFVATGTYADSTTQNLSASVTWSSSNTGVATLSGTGLATGAGVGSSTITATLGSVSGSTTLTVTAATLVSIAVTPANPSLAKGLTQQMVATGTYTDATTQIITGSVTWTSSNSPKANVSVGGLVATPGVGTATITATSGAISGSTLVTVTAAELVSIDVTPDAPSIAKGYTQQFTATGTYTDATTANLTATAVWSSQNGNVTISNGAGTEGLATAALVGSSLITATVGAVSGSETMTVTAAVLVSIAVTPSNPSVVVLLTQQMVATGTYSDATTGVLTSSVTWSSSDTGKATISNAGGSEGLLTAVATGASTISATKNGVTGTMGVTVIAATLVSIAVTPGTPSVAKGLTQQFTATGTYNNSTTQNITNSATWSSSDTSRASINSATGLATTKKDSDGNTTVGSTTITATLSGVSGTATMTVIEETLVSIAVTPGNWQNTTGNGTTKQFTATGTYTDASTANLTNSVTWTSGTLSTATINSGTGLATCVADDGSYTVLTATLGAITGTANFQCGLVMVFVGSC